MNEIELSIVTTLYRSEAHITKFLDQVLEALKESAINQFEIVVVDDGSPDSSASLVKEYTNHCKEIKLLEFSRNFGHHEAFIAGMRHAQGKLVFNIDSDLETHPSELKRFLEAFSRNQADVVYGYQEVRKGGFFERYSGNLFWKLIRYFSQIDIPENLTTERLMTRQYVTALCSLPETGPFLGGMMYWIGFKQIGIPIKRIQRQGKSTYSSIKRGGLLLKAVTSFSGYPLKLVFFFGSMITIISFITLGILLARKLIYPETLLIGYTSIMVTILLAAGSILMALGIIGLYLERVYNQSKKRPLYIIKSITDHSSIWKT